MKNAMSVLSSCKSYLRILGFLSAFGMAMSAHAQSITWEILPWPANQNWPGPRGNPAITNGNEVILTGQDVLSVQTFTAPLSVSFDVVLAAKSTTDGAFELFFVPTGEPTSLLPNPDIELFWGESQSGNDYLEVQQNHSGPYIWGPVSYPLTPGTQYHMTVNVATNGQVSWAINGVDVGLGTSVVVPYPSFQIRLSSWQPTQVWEVTNFTLGAASTCPNLVGTWSGQMNVANALGGFSTTPLSVQVTGQTTNGCLISGYLTQGNVSHSFPHIRFGWNPWFRMPFTGAIPDGSTVLLNVGGIGSGKASAILDMSQTPPVLTKFVYQPNSGATLTGDLTLQPSSP